MRELRRLLLARPDFHVVDGVSLHGAISRVVSGPTGVFVIETKAYTSGVQVTDSGLTVDGIRPDRDPLRQASKAAAAVRHRLRACGLPIRRVQAVLCVPYARLPRPEWTHDVLVTRCQHLGYLLRHWQEQQLNATLAAEVAAALQVPIAQAAA